MSGIERFSDGSGYVCSLSVRSGVFGLHGYRFYFDGLDRFLRDLQHLYETLSGTARLQTTYEEPFIEFAAAQSGHIEIQGHIVIYDGRGEQLRFSFTTDQTFLPPFIHSVETTLRETGKT